MNVWPLGVSLGAVATFAVLEASQLPQSEWQELAAVAAVVATICGALNAWFSKGMRALVETTTAEILKTMDQKIVSSKSEIMAQLERQTTELSQELDRQTATLSHELARKDVIDERFRNMDQRVRKVERVEDIRAWGSLRKPKAEDDDGEST